MEGLKYCRERGQNVDEIEFTSFKILDINSRLVPVIEEQEMKKK